MKRTTPLCFIASVFLIGAYWLPVSAADSAIDKSARSSGVISQALQDYKIEPLDEIFVEVYDEPQLSRQVKVSASGGITLFLLGQVQVAGKPTAQVEKELVELLAKDLLVNPHVIVTVKQFRQKTIMVTGQVNRPDLIVLPAQEKWTIWQAISAAGGPTRMAKHVYLNRSGKQLMKFRLDELDKVTDPKKLVYVEPNDMITVSERFL